MKKKKEALQSLLPSSITILGKEFKIIVTNLKGLDGDCNIDSYRIRIHQNLEIKQAKSTVFHEALHAAMEISGQKELCKEDQEEALVRMLEHAFYHIVDINKLALDK